MKALKIVFILIAIAFVGVFGYYQIKNNSDNIHFKNPFGEDKKKKEVAFQLSSIESTLRRGWHSQDRSTGELTVSFIIENISTQPRTLYPQNIGVFDCKDQRFAPSLNLYSKVNPLLGYDEINPKTKKRFTLIFEVPINKVYYVGYTDNIESIGKQVFIDNIRQRSYQFETFEDMLSVYNKGAFEDISKPKYIEQEVSMPPIVRVENEENLTKNNEKREIAEEKCQTEQERENKEQELRKSVCRVSYKLNGRQAKNMPLVENRNAQTGFICLKIEVSPNGDVVHCDIDKGTTIDEPKALELCISTTKNIKFNDIDGRKNQSGTIRYTF